MVVFPNAKINIGLHILEKRKDGFHNLESIFYPVAWTDALEIVISENFEFSTSGIKVQGNQEDNLCVKVYHAVKEQFNIAPVKIHLHKNIPVGAGLGGGSSDAAFTLKLLNQIFDLHLSLADMQTLIRPFGSDCAFFIENKPVWAYEKGDYFEKTDLSLHGRFLVMIYPDLHISTHEAYGGVIPKKPTFSIRETVQLDVSYWKDKLINDFEEKLFIKYPLLPRLKEQLYEMGALYTSMSGSGSAIYGIFDKEVAIQALPKNYKIWKGWLS